MHVYFSYIGGGAISPLALIAKDAGYDVSGSDKTDSSPYLKLLKDRGVTDIGIGISDEFIKRAHQNKPIDWFVYSSAVEREYPDHPEFAFCQQQGIKMTKRDKFLSQIFTEKNLKLVATAGTHGKTTTTSMTVWLFKQLGVPVSYSVGAKISFGEMGVFDPASQYFIYEGDEFDRNFLAFHPFMSMITGLAWDHHEIYPTKEDYNDAFRQFLSQSQHKVLWQKDADQLGLSPGDSCLVLDEADPQISKVGLVGLFNRRDAYLVAQALHIITKQPLPQLLTRLSDFPGVSRRFEKITDNLYTDYAHTPEKIMGVMNVALETTHSTGQKVAVIYEPLTNRRMHYTRDQHHSIFDGASKIYWVPSYLAREDPDQAILTPGELIKSLSPQLQSIAQPAALDGRLQEAIKQHLSNGDLVLALSGGGGDSLDEWLRQNFGSEA